jgi:hypothetical protein
MYKINLLKDLGQYDVFKFIYFKQFYKISCKKLQKALLFYYYYYYLYIIKHLFHDSFYINCFISR